MACACFLFQSESQFSSELDRGARVGLGLELGVGPMAICNYSDRGRFDNIGIE